MTPVVSSSGTLLNVTPNDKCTMLPRVSRVCMEVFLLAPAYSSCVTCLFSCGSCSLVVFSHVARRSWACCSLLHNIWCTRFCSCFNWCSVLVQLSSEVATIHQHTSINLHTHTTHHTHTHTHLRLSRQFLDNLDMSLVDQSLRKSEVVRHIATNEPVYIFPR